MYQSVGHDAIEAIAECLDLPLYRRQIKGTPANLEYEYVPTEEDEVEDLYELIKHVKESHPDLEGVSSGAIFSTYQKNRVENMYVHGDKKSSVIFFSCARLGLVSLAYLWEREQRGLLTEMIQSNLHAILIKVAVYGLGREDLGKSIAEMQPKLFSLDEKYGVNVCGEGGEFESLTLDCPLYKRRMVIDESEVIVHRDKADASVYYLKIRKLHTEPK